MQSLNPLNDPNIAYLRAWMSARVDQVRNDTEMSRGASAIEWAIITGILALIAIGVGTVIMSRVNSAANRIKTK